VRSIVRAGFLERGARLVARRAVRRRVAWAVAAAAALPCLLAAGFVAWPLPEGLLGRDRVASLRFTDRAGEVLRELRSREDGRSVPLPDEAIPAAVRDAFLSAEDRRFFRHPGVDLRAALRAALQNLRARRVVSGASTLAMQLSRRLMPRERGAAAKIGEALWALRLTAHLPRERILREYLDRVPLGNSVFGVEAAAQTYFGRPARSLSLGQAALLAGMARSPARFDPYRHPEAARAKQREVLGAMQASGLADGEAVRVAAAAPLDLVPGARAFRAPHLIAHLAAELRALGLDRASLVETTLDPGLQADVEALVAEEVRSLAARHVAQAAVMVVDNGSGEVLAYVGSADFFDELHLGQNDGARALRQPGSALKPFAYGFALAHGYTPASLLSDVETHLSTSSGDYVPKNYDRRVHGPVRLRAALANSYNVPAVRLVEKLGPERVLEVLRKAGFDSLSEDASHYGVGLVLGNGDVSLYELARAYRGLARGGVVEPLIAVRAASDGMGRPLAIPRELAPRRFLPAKAAALLADILSDEGARSPAFGHDNALRLPFSTAAKTGTSRAYVDNWTAGFTRERTVAVWVGNFDGSPMRHVSGITGAAPLFGRVMLRAMRGLHPAPLVDGAGFDEADVCALSGRRAGPHCPSALRERFLSGTAPAGPCAMHRAGAGGAPMLDVGPEFYTWARGEGLPSEPVLGAGPREAAAGAGGAARLILPGDGDEYLIDPGAPMADQTIPVRATAPEGIAALELRTDGGPRTRLPAPFSARLPAARGVHSLELFLPGAPVPAAVGSYLVH
jgi:penicillin-binding protein 1C